MTPRSLHGEDPDRLYTVIGGRSTVGDGVFDTVSLIVAESAPAAGMQSEHLRILTLCSSPTAVVEIAAHLALPVTAIKILLRDLLDQGRITVRHPTSAAAPTRIPDRETLKQVLLGLQRL